MGNTYRYAQQFALPAPDAWQVLIREAVRYTGEQDTLPLNPLWITRQFKEVAPLCEGETCNAEQFSLMLTQREWREGFLAERMQDEILAGTDPDRDGRRAYWPNQRPVGD